MNYRVCQLQISQPQKSRHGTRGNGRRKQANRYTHSLKNEPRDHIQRSVYKIAKVCGEKSSPAKGAGAEEESSSTKVPKKAQDTSVMGNCIGINRNDETLDTGSNNVSRPVTGRFFVFFLARKANPTR